MTLGRGRRSDPTAQQGPSSFAAAAPSGLQTGEAKVTPGFNLDARWVIHTVGPVWRGGANGEAELLASCYRSSLARTDEVGADKVAFPAISGGLRLPAKGGGADRRQHGPIDPNKRFLGSVRCLRQPHAGQVRREPSG